MTSTGNQTWVAHIEQNGLSSGKQQTDFSFKPLDLGFYMVTIPLTAFQIAKIFFIMYMKLWLKLAFQTAYERFLIIFFSKLYLGFSRDIYYKCSFLQNDIHSCVLKVRLTASNEITLVGLSVHPSLNFLKIGSLVFPGIPCTPWQNILFKRSKIN